MIAYNIYSSMYTCKFWVSDSKFLPLKWNSCLTKNHSIVLTCYIYKQSSYQIVQVMQASTKVQPYGSSSLPLLKQMQYT